MDGGTPANMQKSSVAHGGIGAASNGDAALHTEEARHEALGGQALRVALHVANHSLKLATPSEGADEGHLSEEGGQVVVAFVTKLPPEGVLPAGSRGKQRKASLKRKGGAKRSGAKGKDRARRSGAKGKDTARRKAALFVLCPGFQPGVQPS